MDLSREDILAMDGGQMELALLSLCADLKELKNEAFENTNNLAKAEITLVYSAPKSESWKAAKADQIRLRAERDTLKIRKNAVKEMASILQSLVRTRQ